MRLAVFSDIHGNLVAFEAMLADLESVGDVDRIWCLGDLAAFGARPAHCVEKIRAMREDIGKEKFKVIGGNTDRYLVTGERFPARTVKEADKLPTFVQARTTMDTVLNWNLAQLTWEDYEFLSKIRGRETREHVSGYGTIIGYHAIPGNDESMALRPDTDEEEAADALLDRGGLLAIGGHTHLMMQREVRGWTVVNVGSVGMSYSNPGQAEWGLFTIEDGELSIDMRVVPYDVDKAIEELRMVEYPAVEWMANRYRQGVG